MFVFVLVFRVLLLGHSFESSTALTASEAKRVRGEELLTHSALTQTTSIQSHADAHTHTVTVTDSDAFGVCVWVGHTDNYVAEFEGALYVSSPPSHTYATPHLSDSDRHLRTHSVTDSQQYMNLISESESDSESDLQPSGNSTEYLANLFRESHLRTFHFDGDSQQMQMEPQSQLQTHQNQNQNQNSRSQPKRTAFTDSGMFVTWHTLVRMMCVCLCVPVCVCVSVLF